jgi:hypothetical protein
MSEMHRGNPGLLITLVLVQLASGHMINDSVSAKYSTANTPLSPTSLIEI